MADFVSFDPFELNDLGHFHTRVGLEKSWVFLWLDKSGRNEVSLSQKCYDYLSEQQRNGRCCDLSRPYSRKFLEGSFWQFYVDINKAVEQAGYGNGHLTELMNSVNSREGGYVPGGYRSGEVTGALKKVYKILRESFKYNREELVT